MIPFDKKYRDTCLDLKTRNKNIKNEATERGIHFKKYLDTLGLHVEPPLMGVKSTPYSCSDVLQTSVIDSNSVDLPSDILAQLPAESVRIRKEARNHHGYKHDYQLMRGERFGFKVCAFLHALAPTSIPKGRKDSLFFRKKAVRAEFANITNSKQHAKLLGKLNALNSIRATGCFTKQDFLHYRFWFLDCDWPVFYSPDELEAIFEYVGLKDYLLMIVRTSPTKYHIYMRSEMVCTMEQAAKWPIPLDDSDLDVAVDQDYRDFVKKELMLIDSKEARKSLRKIAKRGIPAPHRVFDLNCPVPEDAELIDGEYYGDDLVHARFINMCNQFSKFFNSDPRVYDPTRIVQIPGYTNPKNGWPVEIVYSNPDAKVLTVSKAESTVPRMQQYKNNHNKWFYDEIEDYKLRKDLIPDPPGIFVDEYEKYRDYYKQDIQIKDRKVKVKAIKAEIIPEKIEVIPEKIKVIHPVLKNLPYTPEDYARQNNILHEIIWSKEIYGKSNDMLLAFSRYAINYVNPKDDDQLNYYFDTIMKPYFIMRESKDINADPSLSNFRRRFFSLAKNENKKDMYPNNIDKKEEIANRIKASITDYYKANNVLTDRIKKEIEKSFPFIQVLVNEFLIYNKVPYLAYQDSIYYEAFIQSKKLKCFKNYNRKKKLLINLGILEEIQTYKVNVVCKRYRLHLDKVDNDVYQLPKGRKVEHIPFDAELAEKNLKKQKEKEKELEEQKQRELDKQKEKEKPLPIAADKIDHIAIATELFPDNPWDYLYKMLDEMHPELSSMLRKQVEAQEKVILAKKAQIEANKNKDTEGMENLDVEENPLDAMLLDELANIEPKPKEKPKPQLPVLKKPPQETIDALQIEIDELTLKEDDLLAEFNRLDTKLKKEYDIYCEKFCEKVDPYPVPLINFKGWASLAYARPEPYEEAVQRVLESRTFGPWAAWHNEIKTPVVHVYKDFMFAERYLRELREVLNPKKEQLALWLSDDYGKPQEEYATLDEMEEMVAEFEAWQATRSVKL